jgi:D-threonate/D-erythronate kinase
MIKKAVVSDDLTGGMDAGVQLTKKGYTVNVILDVDATDKILKTGDIAIFDIESRYADSEEASDKVTKVLSLMDSYGLTLCYKKIDSTLRGNLGKEMEVILDKNDNLTIAFVPALPYNGRTTFNSRQYIYDIPVTRYDISKDPIKPVPTSFIPDLLKKQTDKKISCIKLEDVRAGSGKLPDIIKGCRDKGARIVVFDTETDSDLYTIAQGIANSSMEVLPVGSAGLFPATFSDAFPPSVKKPVQINEGPLLIMSSSSAKATKQQITYARKHGVKTVTVNIENMLGGNDAYKSEVDKTISEVCGHFDKGYNVLVDFGVSVNKADKDNAAQFVENRTLRRGFACDVVSKVKQDSHIVSLMIIGGDTAGKVLTSTGSYGIKIIGEPVPYVPAGMIQGGLLDGVCFITKAGGFGRQDCIIDCINYLKDPN